VANIRLIAPNAFDAATLTDSPAMVATLPVGNLQDAARARVARSVGLPATQYVRGDWPASAACSGFALWRHNLTGAATLRLKLWAGLGQSGTLLYDSGLVAIGSIVPYGELVYGVDTYGGGVFKDWPLGCVLLWFNAVSALSFELAISDPANTAGYLQACRIFLGQYFSPAKNFNYGAKLRWEDDSTQERTDGNSLRTDSRDPYRIVSFDMAELCEAERASLSEILRMSGKSRDLFVAAFPEVGGTKDRDYSFAAKIIQMPDLTGDRPLNYQSELVLAEA
jgi:hypothetical protein